MKSCFSLASPFFSGQRLLCSGFIGCRSLNKTISVPMRFGILIFSLTLFSASAATWYVDNTATGSQDGTSWATAWTSITSATKLAPGDTVYISGGPYGSSQTYTGVSNWQPAINGTPSSPITFAVGQDSNHNGNVIFNGSGAGFFWLDYANSYPASYGNNVTFDGTVTNANHMTIQNYSSASFSCAAVTNLILRRVNIINAPFGSSSQGKFELSYCYIVSSNQDHAVNCGGDGQGVVSIIHDCFFLLSRGQVGGGGDDGIQCSGPGSMIYSNFFFGWVIPNYTAGQHQDSIQTWNSNIRIFNNYFLNLENSGMFFVVPNSTYDISNTWVYNNIAENCVEGICFANNNPGTTANIHNCVIANNINADCAAIQYIYAINGNCYNNWYSDDVIANNITLNCTSFSVSPSATSFDNVTFNSSNGNNEFMKYVSSTDVNAMTTNQFDFHLLAAATNLIGQAYNLSSYFTIDKHGNTRPVSGAWDVGPYMYGNVNTNPMISILPSAILNFGSVLTNTTTYLTNIVQNSGGGNLVGTAGISSSGSSVFAIISGAAYSLGASQSTNLVVRFTPSAVGAFTNTITFTVTGGSGITGTLSGTGVANYPAPQVSTVTQSGSDVDTITPGVQVFAGYNESYSGSASDPSGLPLSWQWIYTINGGSGTVLQSGTGAVATVSYTYPTNAAGSTYVWRLLVSNGYSTSESDLTVGVEAPPVVNGSLTFQASAGNISGPFVLTNGCIYQSVLTGTNGGQFVFFFQITNSNIFAIEALVNAPNEGANSFYVNIDTPPTDPTNVWDIPTTTGFTNEIVTWRGNGASDEVGVYDQQNFSLNAGLHQLIIKGREAGTELEQITIVQLPPAPSPPVRL